MQEFPDESIFDHYNHAGINFSGYVYHGPT